MALDDLKEVIETLQGMIGRHRDYLYENETRTRQVLIDPLLKELGWNVSDPDIVQLEYKVKQKRADYVLMWNGKPIAVIEAKRLGSSLEDNETTQVHIYANQNGIPYMIVTDGNKWEMYEVFKPVPLEERRLMKFQLSQQPAHENALQALRIWKPNLASGSPKPAMESVIESSQPVSDSPSSQPSEIKKEQHPQPASTPEQSTNLDNPSEQPPDDEDSKPKARRTLIFEGEPYKVNSYEECWFKCLEILSKRCRDRFDEVLTLKLRQNQRVRYFSKTRGDFPKSYNVRKVPGTDIYARLHFHTPTLKMFVEKLAAHFGCEASIKE
jgi:hypothetical protein